MIDIHTHIFPGIDDGAIDLDQSVEMCLHAAAAGCSAMVATPHQRHPRWMNTDRSELEGLLSEIRDRIGPGLELFLGAEIRIGDGLLDDLEDVGHSGLCPLADSSYSASRVPAPSIELRPKRGHPVGASCRMETDRRTSGVRSGAE